MITRKDFLFILVFLIVCFILIIVARNQPIGDFGNYYYGSRVFIDNRDASLLYTDIHQFNEQIKGYGEKNYFENYIPVPPFSIIFYYPFVFFKPGIAKLIFNILSALLLCFAVLKFLKIENKTGFRYLVFLPVLLMPLYYNFAQGQSYMLVTALLLWTYIAWKKRLYFILALCIALLFHLKIFPAIIIFYFIIRGNYKIVAWSVLAISALLLVTALIVGKETVLNYYTEIVPRLFKNEIVDPFYYGHQSVHIFFKNAFTYDDLSNPSPILNLPVIASLCEGVIIAIIVYLLYVIIKKRDDAGTFGLFVFSILLVNKYLPSYSLLMTLPFVINQVGKKNIIVLLLLAVASNIPLAWVQGMPWVIQYFRVTLMLIVFILEVKDCQPLINGLRLAFFCVAVIIFKVVNEQRKENFYLAGISKTGVYYDLNVKGQSLFLNRCMGDKDYSDSLLIKEKVQTVQPLGSHPLLKNINAKKIYLINNDILLYLSDFQQGVGMYRPRIEQIR